MKLLLVQCVICLLGLVLVVVLQNGVMEELTGFCILDIEKKWQNQGGWKRPLRSNMTEWTRPWHWVPQSFLKQSWCISLFIFFNYFFTDMVVFTESCDKTWLLLALFPLCFIIYGVQQWKLISGAICGFFIISLDYDWTLWYARRLFKYVLNHLALLEEGTHWQLNFIKGGGRFIWVIMRLLLGNRWKIEIISVVSLCNKNTSCLLIVYCPVFCSVA